MASKRRTVRSPRQVPAKGRAGAAKPRVGGRGAAEPRKSRPKVFVGGRGAHRASSARAFSKSALTSLGASGRGTSGEPGKSRAKVSLGGRGAAEPRKPAAPKTERIQLRRIAQARSGDKGDIANVALFAPTPETYAIFLREVTADRVKKHFGAYVKGRVDRYEAPNVRALNFVCHAALGGGGAASLRSDPLGKSYGSNLLRMEIDIPLDVLKRTPKLVAPKELPEG